MRLTYRITDHQRKRLEVHRAKLQKDLGQDVSWQLTISSVIEAGLDVLDVHMEGDDDKGN